MQPMLSQSAKPAVAARVTGQPVTWGVAEEPPSASSLQGAGSMPADTNRDDSKDANLVLAGTENERLLVIWMRAVRAQKNLVSVGPDFLDGPLDEVAARPLNMDVFPIRRCVPALTVALTDSIMPIRSDFIQ